MKTRHLFNIGALLALISASPLAGAERDVVIWLGGCTGFVVEGDLLVTAKHCRHPETITVSIQRRSVTARKVYTYPGQDGPVVFHLEGGPHESLPVASRKPQIGERVYSLGYPGGHWARIEGEVIGGNGVDVNYTNHRIATGNSGGPLLNAQGEVIGVALFVDADISVHRSGFAGWRVTTDAVREARNRVAAGRASPGRSPWRPKERSGPRPVVVVFASEHCRPCEQLKRDVRAGYFAGYEFVFVYWDPARRSWSDPDLYRQFRESCQPGGSLAFPTIWVKGTNQYRIGYSAGRRGGLLGWLREAVRHLIEGLIGRKETPPPFPETSPLPAPKDEGKPESDAPPKPNAPDPLVEKLLADIAALREEALKTKAELKEFKDSGVVGKIKALAQLKSEKDVTLDRVQTVKADVEAVAYRLDRLSGLVQTAVSLATWLGGGGLTGGIGGLILGGLAVWRTLRRRQEPRSARDPPTNVIPSAAENASVVSVEAPVPVAVDSPPLAQKTVTETNFVPYEKDTYAKAVAWAQEQIGRKYPGAVGTLTTLNSLVEQYLSAQKKDDSHA